MNDCQPKDPTLCSWHRDRRCRPTTRILSTLPWCLLCYTPNGLFPAPPPRRSCCLRLLPQARIRMAVRARTARRDYEVLFKGMKARQLAGQVRSYTDWHRVQNNYAREWFSAILCRGGWLVLSDEPPKVSDSSCCSVTDRICYAVGRMPPPKASPHAPECVPLGATAMHPSTTTLASLSLPASFWMDVQTEP